MFSRLVRRVCESAVVLFAALGFLHVPLGKHTGYEHFQAIMATPAARDAVAELTQAALGLRSRVLGLGTANAEPAPARPRRSAGQRGLSRATPSEFTPLHDAGVDASVVWHAP